jgi:hypothetical protein
MTPSVLLAAFAQRLLERFGALFFSSNLQTREAWPQTMIDQGIDEWARLNP